VGSVVLGGLTVSTVFTIFLIPALLLFFIQREQLRPAPVEREREADGALEPKL
jgi:HAE1 family hydrophobic/amphiphilic exporter-1